MIRSLEIFKRLMMLFVLALFGGVTGCSNVASQNMIPESFDQSKHLGNTVQVVVDTVKANDHFKNWVKDPEFKKAIEQSLLKANLFDDVSVSGNSHYQLRVTVTSVGNFWGGGLILTSQ